MKFELAPYVVVVQHISHNADRISFEDKGKEIVMTVLHFRKQCFIVVN